MIRLGHFTSTVTKSITDTPTSYQVPNEIADKRFAYYIVSDQPFHVERTEDNAESATDATTSSARVPAGVPVLVNTFAGDWLSFIAGADASADGTVWITGVDH